jgi:hypothetical protein
MEVQRITLADLDPQLRGYIEDARRCCRTEALERAWTGVPGRKTSIDHRHFAREAVALMVEVELALCQRHHGHPRPRGTRYGLYGPVPRTCGRRVLDVDDWLPQPFVGRYPYLMPALVQAVADSRISFEDLLDLLTEPEFPGQPVPTGELPRPELALLPPPGSIPAKWLFRES